MTWSDFDYNYLKGLKISYLGNLAGQL